MGLSRYASAARGADGRFYLSWINMVDKQLSSYPLPGRAHHVVAHPDKPWLFVVARRPQQWIEVIDTHTGKSITQIRCDADHQMCGHAQITQNGRWLLSTEQATNADEGLVVVRDIHNGFKVEQQWPTGGIGPHELRLSPDQRFLAVANGGILTEGREKLNLDSMSPSLAYLDMINGQLLDKVELGHAYHQSGIRHLDVAADGRVIMAMQYEGEAVDIVPLVATHRMGEAINSLAIPLEIYGQLKQYCGSACFDISGRYAAVSAPRGGLVMLWDLSLDRLQGVVNINDGCGLAPTESAGEFLVSSGNGGLYRINSDELVRQQIPYEFEQPINWDNHLSII